MINDSKIQSSTQFIYFKTGFYGEITGWKAAFFEMQTFCLTGMAQDFCTVLYSHSKTVCIDKYFIVYSPQILNNNKPIFLKS